MTGINLYFSICIKNKSKVDLSEFSTYYYFTLLVKYLNHTFENSISLFYLIL